MGELDLRSALNQRFDAEIELTNIGGLESDEIIANLASQADFERVGVERNYQLTDLRFSTRVREDGEFIVQVTSSRPVIEPFLNFIVEVIWPTGRILREYTVLLDPPVFGTEGVERIEPSTVGSTEASSGSGRMTIPPASRVSSGRSGGVVTEDKEFGMTGQGDTLWTIASAVRPDESVSVQQTMLALQRANPEAFINNNINLLKAGYVLRIPDMNEIRAETREDALAEVKLQNEEYGDYQPDAVTQLDARRTASRDAGSDEATEDGELRLVSASDSGRQGGSRDAGSPQLDEALAVAKEDLDRARRANTELNVRLDDLASQVETLNELVQVKDNQLAALKNEVTRMQSAPSTPAASTVNTQASSGGAAAMLGNPLVLGGVGVLLVGLIAGGLILSRKRKQAAGLEEDDFQVMLDEPEEPDAEVETSGEDEEGDDAEDDEDVTQQTSDVLGEAEIYIAYGRFPQAISFLQQAIENEPDRSDIQLKLLEVYVQTEDAVAFNMQYEQLRQLGDADANARAIELQAQIPGAAESAAASMDEAEPAAEPVAAADDDDGDGGDLSFDLDDLDAETADDDLGLDTNDDADELSLDEAMELGEADLDLDLDAAMDEAVQETEEEAMDLDLDLDLEEDIDLEFASDDDDALDLGGDDDGLDLGGDDDEISLDLDLDDDDAISLDLGDDDALDLSGDDDEISLDLDDDDAISLDLGDDDALDLSGGDDEISLDLGDDDEIDLGDDLDLGDDDELSLDLDDDDALDLGELDLGDDDLDLGELDLDDDEKKS
jgi:pilus assembly protein FimV